MNEAAEKTRVRQEQRDKSKDAKKFKKRVKLEELYNFVGQLATLLNAGVPLITSLSVLAQQTEAQQFREVLERIRNDVNTGTSLSDAMAKYESIFSKLVISMVRVAEETGDMAEVLGELADYLKEQDKLRKKIKSAIVYPRFVLGFFLLVLSGIVFGLIPKFKSIFESFDAELPLPTVILISISDFAKNNLLVEIALVAALLFGIKHYLRTETGRRQWDSLKLKLPMVGDLVLKASIARFCHTLSVLLRSGVSLVEALEIAANTVQNVIFADTVVKVRRGVVEGSSFNNQLARHRLFPPMIVKMVAVGEESGALDEMLDKIAEMYTTHVDGKIAGLSSIIEPVMMVGLGAMALVVIIALYLPIFNISGAVH